MKPEGELCRSGNLLVLNSAVSNFIDEIKGLS
jgi:hypothetical protein